MIKTEKLKQLLAIADNIPPVHKRGTRGVKLYTHYTKVRGNQIIAAGNTTYNGEKVDPRKFYRMRLPIMEDHRANITAYYKQGGDKMVQRYVRSMRKAVWRDVPFRKKVQAVILTPFYWIAKPLIKLLKKKAPAGTGA